LRFAPCCAHVCSVGTVFFGAFAFGIGFDTVSQKLWDSHNRGVSAACWRQGLGLDVLDKERQPYGAGRGERPHITVPSSR
jgi:hypothetical protein